MKLFFSYACAIFVCITANAQPVRDIHGIWEGTLHASVDLRIVFHFAKDTIGNWTGTMDSPDQNAKGIPLGSIELVGDSLIVQIPAARGKYLGVILTDSSISGKWVQGVKMDLQLHKVEKISGLIRPQTPVPPFPYAQEDIEYDSPDKALHYGATITTPTGAGPFPAVVLITGSGAQDRDETLFEHKPFAVIADYLTRRGIIVLRVDDRGMGKSTGSFSNSTSLDFAKDVNNSLDFLKTRAKVDVQKLGLIGHSEGGMIAPIVGVQRTDINFMILLAGPGEKNSLLLAEQNAAILTSSGINKEAVQTFQDFYPAITESIVRAKTSEEATNNLNRALDVWMKKTPSNQVLATTGIYNDSTRKKFTETIVNTMYNPWFLYFISFDPQLWLIQLHCKVLALNGEKDLQVPAGSNLKGIQSSLEKSKSRDFEVHMIPGLNHLFQTCKQCTVQEYGRLEESFSPVALQMMGDWIDRHVK